MEEEKEVKDDEKPHKKPAQRQQKGPKIDQKSDDESKSASKSKLGKRHSESHSKQGNDSKRKKTQKGEVSTGGEKRRVRHIEWQYGRHCSRKLWIGRKVKVKAIQDPAKNDEDSKLEYKSGKLIDIRADENGKYNEFNIEFVSNKKKSTEWVSLSNNRVYIYGQMLFLKYSSSRHQIEQISRNYGWKSKNQKPVPMPVIELIDANDESLRIIPHEDSNQKIPIQYFYQDKAKRIFQHVLYDYREFKDDEVEYLRDNFKNGEKLYLKITGYRKHYLQWVEKYSKIPVDISQSLKEYA